MTEPTTGAEFLEEVRRAHEWLDSMADPEAKAADAALSTMHDLVIALNNRLVAIARAAIEPLQIVAQEPPSSSGVGQGSTEGSQAV